MLTEFSGSFDFISHEGQPIARRIIHIYKTQFRKNNMSYILKLEFVHVIIFRAVWHLHVFEAGLI